MAEHRTHGVAFKRPVSRAYLGGETLHGLAKRHDLARNLIRVWVGKYQAGTLDADAAAADLLQTYEARIAALERWVGRQALERDFLKGARRPSPRPRNAPTSAMAGPTASAGIGPDRTLDMASPNSRRSLADAGTAAPLARLLRHRAKAA